MSPAGKKPSRSGNYYVAWARIGPIWYIVGKTVSLHLSRMILDNWREPGKNQRVTKCLLREGDHPVGPSTIGELDMLGFDEFLNEMFHKPLR